MTVKQSERLVVLIGAIIFITLIFFAPAYGWKIRAWISGAAAGGPNSGDTTSLADQNEALKAQLATLQVIASQLPRSEKNYLRAMVYSRYPFNFKNEITVDAGSLDGVALGKAAIFNGILIGTVSQIFPREATIQTVFDDNFKLPVRIGRTGTDALLVGGAAPMATLISKKAPVVLGDPVYAAAPGIPYGLPLGIIVSTSTSADGLFQEAPLNFVYDMNAIETLLVAQ